MIAIPPAARPFLLLAAIIAALAVYDPGIVGVGLARSMLQQFATIGPVALALGLTMIVGEFDLSVAGMFSLGGCIAVLGGGRSPAAGLGLAALAGLAAGLVQGVLMTRLRLSSIAVTLGGLLTLTGLAYVLTDGATIGFARMDIAELMNRSWLGLITLRSAAGIAMYAAAALLMAWTRIGRDVVATGSDRRAAWVAGVAVDRVVIGVFASSGVLTAAGGALLGFSLAAAAPGGLSDALVPAIAAAIIGGVSTAGGYGTPLGIGGGVLVLGALRAGLSAAGAAPYAQQIITGLVLLAVALADAGDLRQRLFQLRRPAGTLPRRMGDCMVGKTTAKGHEP